jgi:rhamnogalacturonyl hydrolase YesR
MHPAILSLRLPALLWFSVLGSVALTRAALPTQISPAPGSTARVLPIASDAFAGSSVNVIANLQNTLFTDHRMQYAAFYASDATLVLARREIGQDAWETVRTPYKGNVSDAHNTIALVVDGAGFLHVSWDHHGHALNYCRSVAPGSLELGPKIPMTGSRENKVTYPVFLHQPSGDLLFFYRDGSSGRGNLVLNRYTTSTQTWAQVHASLLDGENQRNAYPMAIIDGKGVVHLAWTWRESSDVSSNHDLCYARSTDGGTTWTTSSGAALNIPITAATSEYAVRIPQKSSLMNPPSITVDPDGNPLLANYWAPEGSNIPQYHLVRYTKSGWQTSQVTQRTTPFELAGTATKRPPISRATLLSRRAWRKPVAAYLVYRDDERGGRAVLASCNDLNASPLAWTFSDLTADSVGAWEPTADLALWQRFHQLHLLVQPVEQRDGNDSSLASPTATATTIASLIWSPFIEGMVAQKPGPLPAHPAGYLERPVAPGEVLKLAQRTADWWLAQSHQRDPAGWEIAPFYIGTLALSKISPDPKYHDAILAQAEANKWEPSSHHGLYHADDHCVVQAYVELYRKHRDARMLAPTRAHFDKILAAPATAPIAWGLPRALDRWSWCDALFMGPASWLMMAEATGDKRYVEFAVNEWQATTDALYIEADAFYARDESYLDLREPNGRRLYWARGNGWVVAGLCNTIDALPTGHPAHGKFKAQYLEMMDALLASQQPDGLWRAGLLDATAHTARETSGSAFNTFALAWGLNRGWLDRTRVEPAVRRAWLALAACVNADGKLEHVQPIGAAPEGFDPRHTEPFGIGAFLLACCEVYRLVGGKAPVSP